MTTHDTKSHPTEATPRQPLAAGDTPPDGSVVASDTSILTPSMVAADASVPASIARLQHYRLLELVGRGGMGDVYRAHDEMFNRIVAVKVLPPDLAKDEQFVSRFRREAKAVAGLSHPNILSIYTINHDRGHFFFAMQFVDGESLEKRLRRVGVLPLHETLRIVTACLSALEAAHAHGLIHRDVKPGNVLLQNGCDHVYLVDFGLVRQIDDHSMLTVTGMVMGTADYMAPEQARGQKNLDPRTDLYSIGAMLYCLLAGRLPFDAQSFQAMLYSHAYEKPFPLQEAAPDLPAALVEIVNRLLAKQPNDRPASCREVLAALEPFRKFSFRTRHVTAKLEAAALLPNSDSDCATFAQLPESYGLWQRCSDRAASYIGRRTPQWLQELKSTEKQIDAVLSAAQRRRRHLLALRDEGRELSVELHRQAEAQVSQNNGDGVDEKQAAAGNKLRQQASDIDSHVARLDLQLAKIDTAQARLASRRDVLAARLEFAPKRRSQSSANFKRSLRQVAVVVVAVVALFAFFNLRDRSEIVKPPAAAIAPFDDATAKKLQQAWADYLGLPVERDVELPGGTKLTMVLIPPGEFLMGSPDEERSRFRDEAVSARDQWAIDRIPSEGPQHRVRITKPFYLGKYEVTQAQWQSMMGSNPSGFQVSPEHPVENVSWHDIQPFLAKLNQNGRAERMTFALPTEAQWEYACRSGTTTAYYLGAGENDLREYGWFGANSGGTTHPTGELQANGFGLYDMHGNVWEWCADWYAADYYAMSAADDPTGPSADSHRVSRGGRWIYRVGYCRSAFRSYFLPERRDSYLGFRLAAVVGQQTVRDPSARDAVVHTLQPGESLELLPFAKLPDDVVLGRWRRGDGGVLFGSGGQAPVGHARLQLPVRPLGNFEIVTRFSRLGNTDANLVFPVGKYSARATFGQWPEGSLVSHVGSEKLLGRENAVGQTSDSGLTHEARIVVRTLADQAVIEVYVDGKLSCGWEGACATLANNVPCAIPDTRAIGLTVCCSAEVCFHSVSLKMLTGHAEIGRGANEAPSNLSRDLVAHYKFNEGQGSVVRDATGKHDGQIVGATWVKGMDDGALHFDGDDYVRIASPLLNRRTHYTFAAWARYELSPKEFHLYADFSGNHIISSIRLHKGFVHTAAWNIATPPRNWRGVSTPDNSASSGKWLFVVARFTGGNGKEGMMKVWIDDKSYEFPMQTVDAGRANNARIGASGRGEIEEIRLYDRALTDAEVSALYDLGNHRAAAAGLLAPSAPAQPDASSEIAGPIEDLNAKIKANPADYKLYEIRAHWYAARQRWREACAEYELCLVRNSDIWWCRTELTRLYLFLGDQPAYERHCQYLHQQLARRPKGADQVQMMRPLCLDPRRWEDELAKFDPLAEAFHAQEQNHGEILRTIVELRYLRGRWRECIAAAAKLVPGGPKHVIDGYPWLYRIMALDQLGRSAEAKKELKEFKEFMEAQRSNTPKDARYDSLPLDRRLKYFTFNSLEAQIVYREASQLILGQREELNIAPAVEASKGEATKKSSELPLMAPPSLPQLDARGAHTESISAVVVAEREGLVITGGADAKVHLWDAKLRQHIAELTIAPADIGALGISPDNRWLAIGTTKGEVQLWNLPERNIHLRWTGAGTFVRSFVFSPDNKQLYIAGKKIFVWPIERGSSEISSVLDVAAFDLALIDDGDTLIAGSGNGGIEIYSLKNDSRRQFQTGGILHAIDVSPDGQSLLTLGGAGWNDLKPGLVQTWRIATGEKIKTYVGHRGFVSDGEFTADGKHIVTGGRNDRTLRVWDVESANEVARVTSDSHCFGFLAVAPVDQYVASGGGTHYEFGKYEDDGDNRLFFWSLEEIRARKTQP